MRISNGIGLIRILLAFIVLQSPCHIRTGYPAIDRFVYGEYDQHIRREDKTIDHGLSDEEAEDQSDWENQAPSWEVEEPQGEFVAPVAPVAPAGPGAAPQGNPPPAAALPGAPVILSTYFPSPIPADGVWHYGWIDFTDADGDVDTLKIEIMWTTAPVKGPGATRDAEIEGPPTAGKVRMRFT